MPSLFVGLLYCRIGLFTCICLIYNVLKMIFAVFIRPDERNGKGNVRYFSFSLRIFSFRAECVSVAGFEHGGSAEQGLVPRQFIRLIRQQIEAVVRNRPFSVKIEADSPYENL